MGNQKYEMFQKYETYCCDMDQSDTIGKIELIPFSVLSTDNTNSNNRVFPILVLDLARLDELD